MLFITQHLAVIVSRSAMAMHMHDAYQRLRAAGVTSSMLLVLNADHDLQPTDGPTDPSSAAINSRLADFFDQHLR